LHKVLLYSHTQKKLCKKGLMGARYAQKTPKPTTRRQFALSVARRPPTTTPPASRGVIATGRGYNVHGDPDEAENG